jgi:hypothetical protein
MVKHIGTVMLILIIVGLCAAAGSVSAQDIGEPLIQNGDFTQGRVSWSFDQPCSNCWIDVLGDDTPDRNYLAWERTNSNSDGSGIWARQTLNQDVSGYDHLMLDVKLRVDFHSLPNSGWWSDQNNGSGEYPVKIVLSFLTSAEELSIWNWGFLSSHDGSTQISNYTLVPAGEWYALHIDLLSSEWWVNQRGLPLSKPAVLQEIVVGGNGWDFGGAIQDIQITGTRGGGSGEHTETGFIVEEYPLVSAAQDQPDHFEFKNYLTEDILSVRRTWREPDAAQRVTLINQVIGAWGYVLTPNQGNQNYTLSHNGSALITDVSHVWPLAVNASGTDFRLLLDSMTNPTLIVTPETVGQLNLTNFVYIAPVYVGDDLIKVTADWDQNKFYVLRNGDVIYTVTPDGPFVEPPVKALWSWDGHWVLEADNDLIIDGASFNQQMGYEQSFGFYLIAGQPFYFFKQNGQIRLSYAQQAVEPYRYDEVVHDQCCEPSMFNISGNESMVWFYALRDGTWYYVEGGIYNQR